MLRLSLGQGTLYRFGRAADVADLDLARPLSGLDKTELGRDERARGCRPQTRRRLTKGFAGVAVEAAGHIDGEDRRGTAFHGEDDGGRVVARRLAQAGAEQAVDEQIAIELCNRLRLGGLDAELHGGANVGVGLCITVELARRLAGEDGRLGTGEMKQARQRVAVAAVVAAAADDRDAFAGDVAEHLACDAQQGEGGVLHQQQAGQVEIVKADLVDASNLLAGKGGKLAGRVHALQLRPMAEASTELPANPRVLLTNDDGIRAEGIAALWRALSPWTGVQVVAPETVQSATGHGVTLHGPLLTQQVKLGAMVGTAVDGRPADCVKLALNTMASDAELVVSGMNMGANVGVDVFYSGTVAAAVEAAFLGKPAVAVSLHLGPERSLDQNYDRAATWAAKIIRDLWPTGLIRPRRVININVPALIDDEEPAGVKVVPQCLHPWIDTFEQRRDPLGKAYYWNTSIFSLDRSQGDTDVVALKEKFITVTPLHFDLTAREQLDELTEKLG